MNCGKRVPKVLDVIKNRQCPMCFKMQFGIVNDTYVILCNAEGFYGKTGFMHGRILVCLNCGFIAEQIDQEVLEKIRSEISAKQS